MNSYSGLYTSSERAAPVEAAILLFDKNLSIAFHIEGGNKTTVSWLLKDVQVSYDFARQETRIRHRSLPGELFIEGKDAAETIKQQNEEKQKPWHKKRNAKDRLRIAGFFLLFIGILVTLYLLLVPWLSEKLAAKVPAKTERQLGDAVYDAMGLSSQEDKAATMAINDFFAALQVNTEYDVRISVVQGDVVNAFALPGGRIVVYTALLKEISSYPELAALLSHEFTHVNNKHSTKSIFRKLGSKVFLGLLFGNFGSVTSVLISHADDIKSLSYSRKLEKEADTDGLKLLMDRGIDPQGFPDLFNHLKSAASGSSLPEFMASHPDLDKRISYIKEMAKGATIKENPVLKAIFEKISK